jgi:phosphate transport system protein
MTHISEKYQHELDELRRELKQLATLVDEAVHQAAWALANNATGEAKAIIKRDDDIDELALTLQEHALRVMALQGPVASDLRLVSSILHHARELERIGDYAKGIAVLTIRLEPLAKLPLPNELSTMFAESRTMLKDSLAAIDTQNADIGLQLKERDDVVDQAYDAVFSQILASMQSDPQFVLPGTYLLWIAHNIERIADRTTNIGEDVEYLLRGTITKRPRRTPKYDLDDVAL